MRFRGGPPLRTCARCQGTGTANVIKVTRHTTNGIPTGTEYDYKCTRCGHEFEIESAGGQIMSLFGSAVIGGIALAFVETAKSPWWSYGGGCVCALASAFLFYQCVLRLTN